MFNLASSKSLRPAAGMETLACEVGQCLAVRRVILTESLSVHWFLETVAALRSIAKNTQVFLS
jgi:hypothetical protein